MPQPSSNSAPLAGEGDGRLLVNLAAIVLLAGMAVGLLVPIYTDELVWRFHERAWIDSGFDVWMNDLCGPNSIARAPAFMMPARWFSATINLTFADPLYIRATGVVLALALVWSLWRLVGVLEADPVRRNVLRACVCGLLATGFLPQLLVLSRPEQPVFLAVMGMALIALSGDWRQRSRRGVWLASAGITLLCALALSYHLKGVLYSAFAMACLVALAPGIRHLLPRLLAGGTIMALNLVAGSYWVNRFACPADPVMAAQLEVQNLSASLANGTASVALIVEQIRSAHIFTYARLATIRTAPMSNWLPAGAFSDVERLASEGLTYLTWGVATVMAVYAVVRAVASARREGGLSALFEPRMILLAALVGLTLLWGLSQRIKNVYETTHMLPAWIIVLVLAWTLPTGGSRPERRGMTALAALLLAVALFTQFLVIGRMTGPLVQAADNPGRLERQPVSLSLADYASVEQDIARAMQGAGMDGPERLNRLLIDDVTYLAMQRHYLPLHALGVTGWWRGPIEDPAAFLVSRGSDGIVAACANLWPAAVAKASRSGEVCAVNRTQLAMLAGGRPFVPLFDPGISNGLDQGLKPR